MKPLLLSLSICLGLGHYVVGMNSEAINDEKLASSGSILLVNKDKELYVVLGVRNKPGKNEHETLSSFHGNIIRRDGIFDKDAMAACKRNLAWEFMMLDGDPQQFPCVDAGVDAALHQRQSRAKSFLEALKPVAMLKNRSWDKQQRPNFIFLVEYADVVDFIENFEANVILKSKTSKWPLELSKLQLVNAQALVNATEKQMDTDKDPENLIHYGCFTECDGHKIYDAFTRTIAASLAEIKLILSQHTNSL